MWRPAPRCGSCPGALNFTASWRPPTRAVPSTRGGLPQQVEGSVAYGLSAALFGECTVKDGRIEQENFNTYPVVEMMEHMPPVETVLLPSGASGAAWGSPPSRWPPQAVLNAIFPAAGKRIRQLPLKDQDLKRAWWACA